MIRFDRLRQLAEHLETGTLGHETFDFSQYNNVEKNKCGTAGCAIGECPILWPKSWRFDSIGLPYLKERKEFDPYRSGMEWFGIDSSEYCHLFLPEEQMTWEFGGKHLNDNATRYEVAANIRAFIGRMEDK